MGSRRSVESPSGGTLRQLSLRPAEPLALVHRQYRHSSHPSFVQPNSLLPTATRAVGRRPKAPRLFPRGAPALRFLVSLKAMQSTVDNRRTLPRPFWRCGGSRGEELLRDARTGPEEEAISISVAQFRTPARAYVFPRRWKGGFQG